MNDNSRRMHLRNLLALTAASCFPIFGESATKPKIQPIPLSGIGKGIRHISYSDQGGRPAVSYTHLTLPTIYSV